MTTTIMGFNEAVPKADREKLMRLRQRYNRLLAMLPPDLNSLVELDANQLIDELADVELIASEMVAINGDMLVILDELARR